MLRRKISLQSQRLKPWYINGLSPEEGEFQLPAVRQRAGINNKVGEKCGTAAPTNRTSDAALFLQHPHRQGITAGSRGRGSARPGPGLAAGADDDQGIAQCG